MRSWRLTLPVKSSTREWETPTGRRVSVVVAVYNAAETLRQCLDSVLAQRACVFELIVMDGASTDGTRAIVDEYAPRCAYSESKPDRGVYHAWNKALLRTTGDWVCFLGADDAFASDDALATLVGAAMPGTNLVYAKVDLVSRDGAVLSTLGVPWNWEETKRRQTIAHPGSLHARSLFTKFGPFTEKYPIAGDYEFLLRVGRAASPVFVDRAVVRFGNEGMSSRHYRQVLRETRDIKAAHPEIGWRRAWRDYAYDRARFEARMRLPHGVRVRIKKLVGV